VSIAQLTLHSREHLVLLRPGRFGLVLHTLFYSDEVRTLDEFRTDTDWEELFSPKLQALRRRCFRGGRK
jgi:non-homologous end joining protein Ku